MKYLLFLILLSGCATPQIYIIDRATLMEMESSGEWPLVEESLKKQTQSPGPNPLPKVNVSNKNKKLHSLLNEEFSE